MKITTKKKLKKAYLNSQIKGLNTNVNTAKCKLTRKGNVGV